MLTGEQEDLTVLLLSSYVEDLLPLSVVNKFNNELLNDGKFWNTKFRRWNSTFILPLCGSYKRYIELYQIVDDDIKLLSCAEKYEYIEVLEFLVKQKKSIFTTGANLLAKYGRLDLLQQLRFTYPDGRGVVMALKNNHHNVAKWVCEKIIIYPDPEQVIIHNLFETIKNSFLNHPNDKEIKEYCTAACKYGRDDLLDWCADYNAFPTVAMIDTAARNGHLHILKWAVKNKIFPTPLGSELALISGHVDVVLWIKTLNIYPANLCISNIIDNKRYKILNILLENGIGPSSNDYQVVVKLNDQEIVEIFLRYGYKPDYHVIDEAIRHDNEVMLNLFDKYHVEIDYHNISQAVQVGNIKMLERFAETDLFPTVKDANLLCSNKLLTKEKKIMMLEWLKSKKILPSSTGFILALNNNDIDILSWLITNKIKLKQKYIDKTIYYDANVLKLFLQNGFIPERSYVRQNFQYILKSNLVLITKYKLI